MIQEPARVQEPIYETEASDLVQEKEKVFLTSSGGENYSPNCNCSKRRTTQTVPMKASPKTTTIPIVINTHPHPRIILIKVPTQSTTSSKNSSSNNNNNKSNRAEQRAPRTRLIRIPFLPGSDSTPSPVKRTLPPTSSLENCSIAATAFRSQAHHPPGMTIYPTEQSSAMSLPVGVDQTIGPPTIEMVTETVPVSRTAQTLASMAGIQLTGADMRSSHQDMSGAMPTATVEEIDVPVFIDEYLQDIEATSSTRSSSGSDKGKENFTETDILDFDFDINLIAEDHIEPKKMDQRILDMDSSDNNNDDYTTLLIDDIGELPLLAEDEICDVGAMRGIDFNQPSYDLNIENILISSQNPMLCSQSQGSSVPTFNQTKLFTEEPILANENSNDGVLYACSQESLGFSHLDVGGLTSNFSSETSETVAERIQNILPSLGDSVTLKLSATAIAQPEKRRTLILDLNKSSPLLRNTNEIGTPQIIEDVLAWESKSEIIVSSPHSTNISTHDKIIENLLSGEEETTIDFSAPNTPYSGSSSYTSPTCQTGFAGFITAPASPAISITSISQFSASSRPTAGGPTKRKRGRPAKDHADGPDPKLMSQMNDEEAKAYKDRLKNNEASRISRRKTKTRDELEIQEEMKLSNENEFLSAKLQRSQDKSSRFKDFLMKRHHHNSTFVKQERD